MKILVKTSDVIEVDAKNFKEAKELFLNKFFAENTKRINYPIEIFEVVEVDIKSDEKDSSNTKETDDKNS